MTLKKGNLLEFRLLAPVTDTSATFRMAAAPIMKRADGSYYDLNFNNDSTISITNFRATFVKTDGTVEVFSVNGVALDGTTSDGRRIYVCTVEIAADASTKMRGIMQDDDGTNAASNLDSDLVIGTMDVGETVKIAWDISSENLLAGSFTAASTTDTVQAGEALDASSGTLGLSLHTDGKYYKYESGSKADFQGLLPRGQNIALDESFVITWLNGTVTTESGLTADTLYHVQDGGTLVTTATSTTKLAGKSRGTTILVGNQDQGIESLTDGAVTTGTATVPSLITAAQVKLGVENFGGVGISGEALEDFSNSFVVNYGFPTFATATNDTNVGQSVVTEKQAMVIFGNGVDFTTLNLAIKKQGSPTDNLIVRIETDSSGEPSGTLVDANATDTVAGAGLSTSYVDTALTMAGTINLTAGTKYWLVISRSGGNSGSNYFKIGGGSVGQIVSLSSGAWVNTNRASSYLACAGVKTAGLIKNITNYASISNDTFYNTALLLYCAAAVKGDTAKASTQATITTSGLSPNWPYSVNAQALTLGSTNLDPNHVRAVTATTAIFNSYPHIG